MQIAQALPFPYDFDPKTTALVLIDMQRDFIEPGGFGETLGNDVSLLEAIVPATQRVLAAWRAAGGLVVHTREAHRPDLSDCPPAKRNRGNPTLRIGDEGPMGRILVAGEPGNQIIEALAPVAGEIVIDKPGKGAFYATDFAQVLESRAIETLIVCGVTTEVCVNTTVREANDRGYRCVVIGDACASYVPALHEAGLEMIRSQGGIFGWVSDSEKAVAALAGRD